MKIKLLFVLLFLSTSIYAQNNIILNGGKISNTPTSPPGISIDDAGKTIIENGLQILPNGASGRVLTSDNLGNASWQNLTRNNPTLVIGSSYTAGGNNASMRNNAADVVFTGSSINLEDGEIRTYLNEIIDHYLTLGFRVFYIQEGHYLVNGPINLRTGVYLQGEGHATILSPSSGYTGEIVQFSGLSATFKDFNLQLAATSIGLNFESENFGTITKTSQNIVENISISTNSSSNTATGLQFVIFGNQSVDYNKLKNISLTNIQTPLFFNSSVNQVNATTENRISDNFFSDFTINNSKKVIVLGTNLKFFEENSFTNFNVISTDLLNAVENLSGGNNTFQNFTITKADNLNVLIYTEEDSDGSALLDIDYAKYNKFLNWRVNGPTVSFETLIDDKGLFSLFSDCATDTSYYKSSGVQSVQVLGSGSSAEYQIQDFQNLSIGGKTNSDGILEFDNTSSIQLRSKISYKNKRDKNGNIIVSLLNKVLTSDANGNATWESPQSDNLGNHTATQNIVLNNKSIVNTTDTTAKGIKISNEGVVEIENQLKITGGNPAEGKVLTSDANGLASWQTVSSLGNVNAIGDNLGNHTATQNINLGSNKIVGNGGTNGLRILSNGSVVVGNMYNSSSTSSAKLTFGAFYNNVYTPDKEQQTSHIRLYEDDNLNQVGFGVAKNGQLSIASNFGNSGSIGFYTGDTKRMSFSNIENTTDRYKLELSGDTEFKTPYMNVFGFQSGLLANKINFGTGNQDVGFGMASTSGVNDLKIVNNSGVIALSTANTDRFLVNNYGNVTIGNIITDDYNNFGDTKLRVKGTVKCYNATIASNSNWPDYVFEKNYSLPSLSNVENFIKENKHLEGVPSAKEVEKEGLDIAEINNVLLKKIEELTLYIIEQNKETEKQLDEIELLKKELLELQKRKK